MLEHQRKKHLYNWKMEIRNMKLNVYLISVLFVVIMNILLNGRAMEILKIVGSKKVI